MAAGTPSPLLPNDRHGEPIQVLAPEETSVVAFSIGVGNDRQPLPAGSQVVEIACQDSCRVAFGDSSLDVTTGTRRLLVAGVFVYKVPTGATHFAVTQVAGSSGVVTLAKLV